MDAEAPPQTDHRRFRPRTIKWCWIAAITAVATLGTMLATGWRIGSPELLVVTATTIFIAWLVVGIWMSRGKFRILSMLLVCAIVAILSSTLIPRMRTATAHRRLLADVTAAGGKVAISKQKNVELDGWTKMHQGFMVPKMFSPYLKYIEGGVVSSLVIPADLVTSDRLRNVNFEKNVSVKVIFQGTKRDYKALASLLDRTKPSIRKVICKRITVEDGELLAASTYGTSAVFEGDLKPEDLQNLLISTPIEIFVDGKCKLSELNWTGKTVHIYNSVSLHLQNLDCPATFFQSLRTDSQCPIDLRIQNCILDPDAWEAVSDLEMSSLKLEASHPKVDQMVTNLKNKNLTDLKLIEPETDDFNLREFSKIGTLLAFEFPYPMQRETLKWFVLNNPRLDDILCAQSVVDGTQNRSVLRLRRAQLVNMFKLQEMESVSKNEFP